MKNKLLKINSRGFEMYVTEECVKSYSNFEPLSSLFALEIYNNNGLFIDVGAHYGYYTLLIGKHISKSNIYAFEPTPVTYDILKKNVELNKVDKKVTLYRCAVSDKESSIKMFTPKNYSSKSSCYKLLQDWEIDSFDVKTYSLDKLITNKKVSLIKIDAEGHEPLIVKGLANTIRLNKEISMLIEFHPNNLISAGFNPSDLLDELRSLNFNLLLIIDHPIYINENISNSHYSSIIIKIENKDKWENFITENGRGNILCIPNDMDPDKLINNAIDKLELKKYQKLFYTNIETKDKINKLISSLKLLKEEKEELESSKFYKIWRIICKMMKYANKKN